MNARNLLLPFSWLYGAAIAMRNWMYDARLFSAERVDVPVIAVGNVVAGGSGKTPCAAMILRMLIDEGKRPALISRGYGRRTRGMVVVSDGAGSVVTASEGGDEPLLIARRFPTIPVIVCERRIDAARRAMTMGADCIVADDAFQHRALARTIDIVLTDAELESDRNVLLPAGDGREPLSSLRRASVVLSAARNEERVRRVLEKYAQPPLYFVETRLTEVLHGRSGVSEPATWLRDRDVVLVTGIARPARVATTLREAGASIVQEFTFGDHHVFAAHELDAIAQAAQLHGAPVVTTEKDWIRLAESGDSSLDFAELDVCVMRMDMVVRGDSSTFWKLVLD